MTREKQSSRHEVFLGGPPIQVLTPPSLLYTAVIGREPVFSRRYGREHLCLHKNMLLYSFRCFIAKDKTMTGEKAELTTRSICRWSPIEVQTPPSLV